jgi:hypothetical protein
VRSDARIGMRPLVGLMASAQQSNGAADFSNGSVARPAVLLGLSSAEPWKADIVVGEHSIQMRCYGMCVDWVTEDCHRQP